jgi:hypothetical protein
LEAFPTNTFTSNVLAMVLGLNYDKDALQTFIRHKRVILFDFANIVWKIFNLLDRVLGGDKNIKVREKEKIKFITNTFKNFFNDNENCLYIIVAKPVRSVTIDDIMTAYINGGPIDNNYFKQKCIILTTTYFDKSDKQSLTITGGSDDFLLWVLAVALYNKTKQRWGDLRVITGDKQKIYTDTLASGPPDKTILSDMMPNDSNIYAFNSTIRSGKKQVKKEDIQIFVAQKIIDTSKAISTIVDLSAIAYLNIFAEHLKSEQFMEPDKKPYNIIDLVPINMRFLMDISVAFKGFDNEIFNIIDAYTKRPPNMKFFYTKYQNQLLPICKPQSVTLSTGEVTNFIMPNTLKFIYYIRLIQVFLFDGVEKALSDDDILDVFQVYGNSEQLVIGRRSGEVLIWTPTKKWGRKRITNISIFDEQNNLPQSDLDDDDDL